MQCTSWIHLVAPVRRVTDKISPLNSSAIDPKPLLTPSMVSWVQNKMALWLYLCLEPILFLQMIWSTSYHHMTVSIHWPWLHLLFTVASVHRRQVLLKLHHHMVLHFEASTCSSPSQPVHRAKPHLGLHHLSHMSQCHVSYSMTTFI
jgi:hypothetical protein